MQRNPWRGIASIFSLKEKIAKKLNQQPLVTYVLHNCNSLAIFRFFFKYLRFFLFICMLPVYLSSNKSASLVSSVTVRISIYPKTISMFYLLDYICSYYLFNYADFSDFIKYIYVNWSFAQIAKKQKNRSNTNLFKFRAYTGLAIFKD